MKKLILAVAVLAASISASAVDKTWNFTTNAAWSTAVTYSVNTIVDGMLIGADGTTLPSPSTFVNEPGSSAKVWSSGSYTTRFKSGGSGTPTSPRFLGIGVSGNSTIQICALSSSATAPRVLEIWAEGGASPLYSVDVVGSNPSAATNPISYSYAGPATTLYIVSSATQVSTLTGGAKGGMNYYMISATNSVALDSKDAISSDLLSKKGDVLENNVGEVKIVSALGATVLSSSDASINISGLSSGVYVAVTEKGTLKFVK